MSHSTQAVRAVYRDLKQQAREVRAYPNEVRQLAWQLANAHKPGKWAFWRHGFRGWYGRRVDLADYTVIPRYDLIAQEVALAFPEFEGVEGTERLWEFLLSPYDRLPGREELLREAADVVAARKEEVDACPF